MHMSHALENTDYLTTATTTATTTTVPTSYSTATIQPFRSAVSIICRYYTN